jgi:hypothetical protein
MTHRYACPLCDSQSTLLFYKNDIPVLSCQQCGHRFAGVHASESHVDQVYGDDYFNQGGAGYEDYLAEKEIITERGRYYAKQLATVMQPGSMLDVGAAAGFLMDGFREWGWQVVGVEPNAEMADYGQVQLDLDVANTRLEDYPTDNQYDLIALVQVLPHFVDINEMMDKVSCLNGDHGYCLVETWDYSSWAARILGENWHEYSPPSVLHWFSRKSLDELFSAYGYKKVKQGRPFRKIQGRHAKSLLQHTFQDTLLEKPVSYLNCLIPDSFSIPYPPVDLFWSVYQKQASCLNP